MKIKNEERCYAKINLEFDSTKKGIQKQEIIGDEETIASLLRATITKLLESGFDREILEYAIKKGLNHNIKKIQVKEIHITKDNEKEFKELLSKLMED